MRLQHATTKDVTHLYKEYFNTLENGINHYVERRILSSQSYVIREDSIIGICSVDEMNCLTGFYIKNEHTNQYSEILDFVIKELHITDIYMSDMDTIYLHEITKRGFVKEVHSFNFTYDTLIESSFTMNLVSKSEIDDIIKEFGEFLEYNSVDINNTDLYTHKIGNDYVCLGFYENYNIIKRASVAMIVNPKFRKQGFGTKTLQFLVMVLQELDIPINARCWVENIASKNTLLKAGFNVSSHTVKVAIKE